MDEQNVNSETGFIVWKSTLSGSTVKKNRMNEYSFVVWLWKKKRFRLIDFTPYLVQDHETEEENPYGSHLFFADLPTLEDDGACTEESGLKHDTGD